MGRLIEGCIGYAHEGECDCVTRTIGPLTDGYLLREVRGGDESDPSGYGWIVQHPERGGTLFAYITPKTAPYREVRGRGSTQGSEEVHQLLEWHYWVRVEYRSVVKNFDCGSFNGACDMAVYALNRVRKRYPLASDPTPPDVDEWEPAKPPKLPRRRGPRKPKQVPDPLIRAMG